VTSLLTEGLVRRGVDVTLFATADSVTTAALDAVAPHGYAEDPGMDGRVWEALHVAHALERAAEFDLIHNQLDWLPLAFSRLVGAPMVTTVHGFSGPGILPAYRSSSSALVSISDADRRPGLAYAATVHHGVDPGELRLGPGGDDLISFGRIHPDKGVEDAIEIARRSGRRLVICGIVQDQAYFAARVEPHLHDARAAYLGAVGPADRSRLLGSAAVLLHPIHFAEPFGLSVVEAMLCGTPVVAYARGSMREVIEQGVTGFAVEGLEEAVAAVDAARHLDRPAVRRRALARFGVDRMVGEYLDVYDRLLHGARKSGASSP
jgi:glycosyltransferase involved in cell wall biosynthesis